MNIDQLTKRATTLKMQARFTEAGDAYTIAARMCIANNDPTAAQFFNSAAYAYAFDVLNPSSPSVPLQDAAIVRMKGAYEAAMSVYITIGNYAGAAYQATLAGNAFSTVDTNEAITYFLTAATLYRNCNLLMHADRCLANAQQLQLAISPI